MIHFDYNDGNYMIDFGTGQITVYDFDNSCFGWYMYDGDYFKTALEGYRSETPIEDSMLEKSPLFIKVTLMEQILDEFECMRNNGEEPLV